MAALDLLADAEVFRRFAAVARRRLDRCATAFWSGSIWTEDARLWAPQVAGRVGEPSPKSGVRRKRPGRPGPVTGVSVVPDGRPGDLGTCAGPAAAPDLVAELRRLFGWADFRPGQEAVTRRALEGRDSLVIMPTGAGKSLCYQLAAMLRPTPTLVVSPLIALMKDQVAHMPPHLSERATFINSTLAAADVQLRLAAVARGDVKLLYAAPERLRQARFADALASAGVGLVVVDEAHCVALWGHDFRPDYLFIRSVLQGALARAAVLALTATATPQTAAEIQEALGRPLEVVRSSVIRTNLFYRVERLRDEEEKVRHLLTWVQGERGAGIVYARARVRCERLASVLARAGVQAVPYHAGLGPEERNRVQEDFLAGRARVVVATTAFGMGVDKPDVRWIVLYNYPTSLEEYVQQVGRAGRDGQASTCTLLVTPRDAQNLRTFARRDAPTLEELRRVWLALRRAAGPQGTRAHIAPTDLALAADLPAGKDPRVYCGVLERAGLIARDFDGAGAMRVALQAPPPDAPARIAAVLDRLRTEADRRVDGMVAFAESGACRHAQVAAHFGDAAPVPCGRCDVCAPGVVQRMPTAPPPPPPDDPAAAILDAVGRLRWPLGVTGLVATLAGSAEAPPSARGGPAFGILAAIPSGTVRRWVRELVAAGHLVPVRNERGFEVLEVGRRTGLPQWSTERRRPRTGAPTAPPADPALLAALRAWRSDAARRAAVPAYIILPDRALRLVAAARPSSRAQLAAVPGMGPRRLEAWADDLLAIVAGAEAATPSGHPDA